MGLLIHVTEVSLFLDVGLETQGDQVGGKHSVEELQGLPQRLLGEHHLAHVETDLWGRDEQRFRSQAALCQRSVFLGVLSEKGNLWPRDKTAPVPGMTAKVSRVHG